jgi:hypothetical protein
VTTLTQEQFDAMWAGRFEKWQDSMILSEYRKLRQKGHRAKDALSVAKRGEPPFHLRWSDDEFVTVSREGFTVKVRWEPDCCDYGDWLGEFTDTWSEGVLENPRANWHVEEDWRGGLVRVAGTYNREYKWFLPQITEQEHYESLRKYNKLGKAEARRLAKEYAEDALNRALEYQAWIVTVTAYRDGIELGGDCLGGIDVDSFDEIPWIVDDHGMIEEAIARAEENLEKLCEFRQEVATC